MVIGITGSSGAGKSTVCEILESKYNAVILNADKIAKNLSKRGTEYFNSIVKEFGTEILLENGELNRPKLASIIYNDDEKRNILNKYTFKYIRQELENRIKKIERNILEENRNSEKTNLANSQIIAIDAPLLFEASLEDMCDIIIAVISKSRELQVDRIIQRDSINRKQAIDRLNAQKENDFYTSKSNYVIVNDGKIEDMEKQIEEIIQNII